MLVPIIAVASLRLRPPVLSPCLSCSIAILVLYGSDKPMGSYGCSMACMHACMHIYIYTHTYTYTYIHTHTHWTVSPPHQHRLICSLSPAHLAEDPHVPVYTLSLSLNHGKQKTTSTGTVDRLEVD